MASVVIPGGGLLRNSSDRGDRMGKNIKTQKNPSSLQQTLTPQEKSHAEFPSLKNLQKLLNIKRAAKHWTAETSLVLYRILRTTRLAYADLPRILRLIWICPNKIPTWIKPTKKYCQIFLPKTSRNQTQKALPDQSLVCSEEGLAGSKRHLLDPPTRASRRNVKIGFFLLWTEFLFWTEKSL